MRDSTIISNDTINGSLIKEGYATYYNYGSKNADGSKFNKMDMSCAFYTKINKKREWLGKKVLVVYGDKKIVLDVKDNGSFVEMNRAIDLTEGAFSQLASTSKGKILVKIYKYQTNGDFK